MIEVRPAVESDVEQIRDVYLATYGRDYAYPQYYDVGLLKRMVFSDDLFMLVAEDIERGVIAGTASVLLDVGAFSDLVGELGRLAVHPDYRRRGVGHQLMEARLQLARDRLHLALIDARASHPFSQRIAVEHGFAPVGFLPMKLLLATRESVVLLAQYFGEALELRKNNPRVIPEVYPVAEMALRNVGLPCDAIADDESAAYPHEAEYVLDELTTEGYAALLRLERGRIRHREVFGPMRLHYGLFKLQARHSTYLIARRDGHVAGAVGFSLDEFEKTARVFEIVSVDEGPIQFLLGALIDRCRQADDVEYVEVDVSAHAPRMQRTLLEHHFVPAAYVPASVFHDVERLDSVRMARLLVPLELGTIELVDVAEPVARCVVEGFTTREILPRITEVAAKLPLFAGLNAEQVDRLAAACSVRTFEPDERLFAEGDAADCLLLVIDGQIAVHVAGAEAPVGAVDCGECLGETSLVESTPRSATATAVGRVEAAVLAHADFHQLVRRRPDIGIVVYRNLAAGLGAKLKRSDRRLADRE